MLIYFAGQLTIVAYTIQCMCMSYTAYFIVQFTPRNKGCTYSSLYKSVTQLLPYITNQSILLPLMNLSYALSTVFI